MTETAFTAPRKMRIYGYGPSINHWVRLPIITAADGTRELGDPCGPALCGETSGYDFWGSYNGYGKTCPKCSRAFKKLSPEVNS